MTPSPVGMRCPECAGQRTRTRTGAGAFGPTTVPYATYTLIALNAIAFAAELAGGGGAGSFNGGGSVIQDFGVNAPAVNGGDWYRVVTAAFLHAGLMHLAFNMIALYVLGTLLEPSIGTPRFVGIYAAGLVGGSLGALLLDPNTTTVGASGAIFGLFAATFLIARGRNLQGVASQIGFWLLVNLVLTLSVPGISIGGHLGGLLGGGLAALAVIAGERGRLGSRSQAAEGLLIAVLVCAGFALAIAVA
jgi:membrane associated rhomboid family serine protease